MTDLVQDPMSSSQSPKRKFSFRFPLGHTNQVGSGGTGHDQSRSLDEGSVRNEEGSSSTTSRKFGTYGRHFSDELKNVADIQVSGDKLMRTLVK